jgi:hypothetical protein
MLTNSPGPGGDRFRFRRFEFAGLQLAQPPQSPLTGCHSDAENWGI